MSISPLLPFYSFRELGESSLPLNLSLAFFVPPAFSFLQLPVLSFLLLLAVPTLEQL